MTFDVDTLRLFLHVLAATVWVGGQITLAGLVPALRGVGPEATQAAARQFGRLAWPAFGVLVLTGLWNIAAESGEESDGYEAVLGVKLVLVVLSGVSAFLHARATTRRGMAVWGALTGTSAIVVLLLGVVLGSAES